MVALEYPELVFDTPEQSTLWGETLYECVPKENHSMIQRKVMATLQDLHKLCHGCFVTSIHNLGLGHYILMASFSTTQKPNRQIISDIRRFGPESNQQLASFVEHRQNDLLADMTRATGRELQVASAKADFLMNVLKVCGKGLLKCQAGSQVSKRLVEAVEDGADRIVAGTSSQHREFTRISKSLKRLKRLAA